MRTEISRLGVYGFKGTGTEADRSNQKKRGNGTRVFESAEKKKRPQRKVGGEEEGSSSSL